jgi:hypothetical protein
MRSVMMLLQSEKINAIMLLHHPRQICNRENIKYLDLNAKYRGQTHRRSVGHLTDLRQHVMMMMRFEAFMNSRP